MLDIVYGTFEGPLDLLLQLIEKEELEITDVSLAHVTDEYIRLLAQLADTHRVEELADFLVVAAKLILIKSRSLLPKIDGEEEEEVQDFKRQLKLYQEFQHAAKTIELLYTAGTVGFPRPYAHYERVKLFSPPKTITCQTLASAYMHLASRKNTVTRLRGISFDERISIQDKMARIKSLLAERVQMYFHNMIQNTTSKTDVIVSFLALLELVKQRVVCVTQHAIFDEISIQPVETRFQ
jgi:segregation and condensation protein A